MLHASFHNPEASSTERLTKDQFVRLVLEQWELTGKPELVTKFLGNIYEKIEITKLQPFGKNESTTKKGHTHLW